MPSIAVLSKYRLSAKGNAVTVIGQNAAVVSAVNKRRNLRMSDSTNAGCRKSGELPKDRFAKVKIAVTAGPIEYWVQLVDSEPNHSKWGCSL
jgi:hypothetical protein